MPKIDRATLTKIAPDPQSVKALEDLFKESTDTSGALATVKKIANDAQTSANAASLAAGNAQARADSAFDVGSAAQESADNAQITADDAKDLATDAGDQVDIIESAEGAHIVGIQPAGNVSGNNVRDAIYSLDANDGSGFRNIVLNGAFTVNQRKYVSGTATTAVNQYMLDRWRIVVSGQSASFVATSNGNLVTAPDGGIEQVIEGALIVQPMYVLSWLGNATCTVDGVAKTNGAVLNLTPGSNCTIRFSGGSVNSVQLEQGKSPHPFEPRPYTVELRLCQRYAYGWTSLGTMGVCGSGGGGYAFPFPTQMRATPSYTGLANATFSDGVSVITITSTSLFAADINGASVSFVCGPSTAGRAAILNTGGNALFSSEF